jgi:hypothetical protein
MKTMKERLARALAVADGKDPDAPAWVRFPGAHPAGVCWRDQYLRKVDAILDELREPDEGARAKVAEEGVLTGCCLVSAEAAGEVWQAMIDHARQGS